MLKSLSPGHYFIIGASGDRDIARWDGSQWFVSGQTDGASPADVLLLSPDPILWAMHWAGFKVDPALAEANTQDATQSTEFEMATSNLHIQQIIQGVFDALSAANVLTKLCQTTDNVTNPKIAQMVVEAAKDLDSKAQSALSGLMGGGALATFTAQGGLPVLAETPGETASASEMQPDTATASTTEEAPRQRRPRRSRAEMEAAATAKPREDGRRKPRRAKTTATATTGRRGRKPNNANPAPATSEPVAAKRGRKSKTQAAQAAAMPAQRKQRRSKATG